MIGTGCQIREMDNARSFVGLFGRVVEPGV